MRKLFLSAILTITCFSIQARVINVSNDPLYPAAFTSIQAAHDVASVGDTIFIKASTISYGTVNQVKQLVVIGEGVNFINGISGNGANISDWNVDSVANFRAWGSRYSGLNVENFKILKPVTSLIVQKCNIYTFTISTTAPNLLIIQSRINNLGTAFFINTGVSDNVLVSNSIIGFLNTANGNYVTGWVLKNNIFSTNGYSLQNMSKCIVENNIFISPNMIMAKLNNNAFKNNIVSSATLAAALPPVNDGDNFINNSGSGNKNAQSPLFVETNLNSTSSDPRSLIIGYTFQLTPSSPGKNAGTDGKDIGVYGGLYPWDASCTLGTPNIPKVTELEVKDAVVTPGTPVKFTFKAKAK